MGNPPVCDIATPGTPIVRIDPIENRDVPVTARTIIGRVDTLGIRSSLMREMRAIHFVTGRNDIGKNFLRPRSADGLKPRFKPPPRLSRHGGAGARMRASHRTDSDGGRP